MLFISSLIPRLYEDHSYHAHVYTSSLYPGPLTQHMLPPHAHRDLERIEAPVYSVKAHEQIVNGIDGVGGLGIGGGAPELVTGSRDGEVTKLVQLNCLCTQTSPTFVLPLPFLPLSPTPPPLLSLPLPLLFSRKCKGVGSSSKGQAGSLHGACRRRDEKRLLDSSFW